MPQVFFFLVDVSMTAVSTGSVAAACSAINRALADIGVRFLSFPAHCQDRVAVTCFSFLPLLLISDSKIESNSYFSELVAFLRTSSVHHVYLCTIVTIKKVYSMVGNVRLVMACILLDCDVSN